MQLYAIYSTQATAAFSYQNPTLGFSLLGDEEEKKLFLFQMERDEQKKFFIRLEIKNSVAESHLRLFWNPEDCSEL